MQTICACNLTKLHDTSLRTVNQTCIPVSVTFFTVNNYLQTTSRSSSICNIARGLIFTFLPIVWFPVRRCFTRCCFLEDSLSIEMYWTSQMKNCWTSNGVILLYTLVASHLLWLIFVILINWTTILLFVFILPHLTIYNSTGEYGIIQFSLHSWKYSNH